MPRLTGSGTALDGQVVLLLVDMVTVGLLENFHGESLELSRLVQLIPVDRTLETSLRGETLGGGRQLGKVSAWKGEYLWNLKDSERGGALTLNKQSRFRRSFAGSSRVLRWMSPC